ncbi:tetratricopeptide repeat protein [Haliangium sp.]|uniref:tetratricopeptide repeat protein n=1 Tax=Haliangium sp. TaxID=2663208 RepID=UPI003D0B312E
MPVLVGGIVGLALALGAPSRVEASPEGDPGPPVPTRADAPTPTEVTSGQAAEPALGGLTDAEVAARFEAAARAMSEGRRREAAEGFVRLAEDAPEHTLASEALFSAAKLYEERLTEPTTALSLYRRLLDRYPQARTALAAQRRAQTIADQLGPDAAGAEALARFTAVLQRFSDTPEADAIAEVEAILAAYPDWPGAPRALLWLAQVHRRGGRHQAALDRYLAAAAVTEPDSDELFSAYLGAGDMATRLGRYRDAEGYYQRLPVAGDPGRRRSLDDALAALTLDRTRAWIYRLCFALLALIAAALLLSLRLAAGSRQAAVRALATVPTEVVFMLPIAAVLTGAALTTHESIGPAVAIVCAGGLVFTWLSGVGLRAAEVHQARFGRLRPLVHAVAVAVAALALVYVALHRNHLLDTLVETVRFGPDV